jgi:hypothetical protein
MYSFKRDIYRDTNRDILGFSSHNRDICHVPQTGHSGHLPVGDVPMSRDGVGRDFGLSAAA